MEMEMEMEMEMITWITQMKAETQSGLVVAFGAITCLHVHHSKKSTINLKSDKVVKLEQGPESRHNLLRHLASEAGGEFLHDLHRRASAFFATGTA
jgi:hypothetical protein